MPDCIEETLWKGNLNCFESQCAFHLSEIYFWNDLPCDFQYSLKGDLNDTVVTSSCSSSRMRLPYRSLHEILRLSQTNR